MHEKIDDSTSTSTLQFNRFQAIPGTYVCLFGAMDRSHPVFNLQHVQAPKARLASCKISNSACFLSDV